MQVDAESFACFIKPLGFIFLGFIKPMPDVVTLDQRKFEPNGETLKFNKEEKISNSLCKTLLALLYKQTK